MKLTPYVEEIPIWNIVLDVFITCVAIMSTPIFKNNVTPFRRGFFCDDDTIRYPYKSSTVDDNMLYSCTTLIPLFTIAAMELWLRRRDGARRTVLIGGWAVPEWTVRWGRHVLLFGYGFGTHELLVNIAKFTVGRLRPHFLTVCKPSVLCNATGIDPHAYITDYECTGPEGFAMFQSRLSFPSGHSAMSFYAAVFTVYFLEKRIRWPDGAIMYKTVFEIFVMILAWFTALSRIIDFKHHWGDVVAGIVLGTLVALFWVRHVLHLQPDPEENNDSAETTFVFSSNTSSPEEKI